MRYFLPENQIRWQCSPVLEYMYDSCYRGEAQAQAMAEIRHVVGKELAGIRLSLNDNFVDHNFETKPYLREHLRVSMA